MIDKEPHTVTARTRTWNQFSRVEVKLLNRHMQIELGKSITAYVLYAFLVLFMIINAITEGNPFDSGSISALGAFATFLLASAKVKNMKEILDIVD